jgi:glycosyl transferase family 25
MQTYVINMANATKRMEHMSAMLREMGIAYERFDALDPERAARHPLFSQIRPLRVNRSWVSGEVACLLSHYELWRLIAEGLHRYGLILEDDVLLHPGLREIIDGTWPLPKDADLVKIETDAQSIVALSHRAISAEEGPVYRRLLSMHGGTGAYILSQEAARFLVTSDEVANSFDMPVDDMLFVPTHPIGRRLRVYQAVPALAIQSVNMPAAQQKPDLGSALEELRNQERRVALSGSGNASEWRRLRDLPRRVYLRFIAIRTVVPFGWGGRV